MGDGHRPPPSARNHTGRGRQPAAPQLLGEGGVGPSWGEEGRTRGRPRTLPRAPPLLPLPAKCARYPPPRSLYRVSTAGAGSQPWPRPRPPRPVSAGGLRLLTLHPDQKPSPLTPFRSSQDGFEAPSTGADRTSRNALLPPKRMWLSELDFEKGKNHFPIKGPLSPSRVGLGRGRDRRRVALIY